MAKVIYLNSLFKGKKPNKKAIELINKSIVEANGINPKAKPKNKIDGRKFILKHTEEFLHHAVDYSMNDMTDSFYQE